MLVSLFLSREGLARRRLFAAALAVSVWSGCGFGGASELAPISVTGKISLDGRPLGEGTVVLISQKGDAASGDIQSDGTYSLSCPAATYSVAVAPVPPPDPLLQQSAAPAAPGVKLPAAYQEVATSGLVAEVKDGSVPIDFELDSKFKGSRR